MAQQRHDIWLDCAISVLLSFFHLLNYSPSYATVHRYEDLLDMLFSTNCYFHSTACCTTSSLSWSRHSRLCIHSYDPSMDCVYSAYYSCSSTNWALLQLCSTWRRWWWTTEDLVIFDTWFLSTFTTHSLLSLTPDSSYNTIHTTPHPFLHHPCSEASLHQNIYHLSPCISMLSYLDTIMTLLHKRV